MIEEQAETVEVAETDQLSEQDALQINEWLDDKIGTDTEDVKVAEDTEEETPEAEPEQGVEYWKAEALKNKAILHHSLVLNVPTLVLCSMSPWHPLPTGGGPS